MAIDPRTTGTYLKPFEKDLSEGIQSLRIGANVPPGDVNLAYVHTPRINPEGNLSVINTADIYDNIIPSDQKESLVAANAEGKLEYIEIVNDSEIQTRAPETIFPSDNITVTSVFKKNKFTRNTALFYRFEISYHYDSKEREPGKRILYDGSQIKITDANGNILDSSYNYEIYITPSEINPNISKVEIYMNQRADENETFFVQYNHIDYVVTDGKIKSVKRKVELYSKQINTELEGGLNKAYLENGKSRVLNPVSAYSVMPIANVIDEQNEKEPKNIFAITNRADKDGYELTVPQKASIDERIKNAFSFRINARFYKDDGTEATYTTGFMTNWAINSEALLSREKLEYSEDFKDISGVIGMTRMDVEEMIIRSLPPRFTTKMNTVEYSIEDDSFNKLYTDIVTVPNGQVECRIAGNDIKRAQAKSSISSESKWEKAELSNVILKNNRIEHQCTVIAEHQKTLWKFKWEVFAKGTIPDERIRIIRERDEEGNKVEREVTETIYKEWDSLSWKRMRGEAVVKYNPDGTYTSVFTPSKLPIKEIEAMGIQDLKWVDIIFTEGDKDCGVEIVNGVIRHRMLYPPPISIIGNPYPIPMDLLLKAEGVKKIGEIFGPDSIYDKLEIPKDIPLKDILLRIERGFSTAAVPSNIETMDFRVNYRFRATKGGYEAMPVDQYINWFGMNRIRLIDFLDEDWRIERALSIDVVAWTMFEELEIAPIYAIRIEEDKRIDIEAPRVADNKLEVDNWYVRVKNGRMFKTISLPGYDPDKLIIPQIYIVYPELIQYAPSLCEYNEVELEYEVTEYDNQEFLGYRTMVVEDEQPIILDEETIQVINNPLYLDAKDDKGYIEVKSIRGKNNKILRIADVDSAKGIIHLLDKINDQDVIKVRYVHQELHYTYKGFERYETHTGVVHVPFPFSIDVSATLEMSVDIEEVLPVIDITGPATLIKGEVGEYKVEVIHPSLDTYYEVNKEWNNIKKLVKKGTSAINTYTFTFTIDSNDYNENISRIIDLTGIAKADGLQAEDALQVTIVDAPVEPVAPTVKINKVFRNEWCLDLVAQMLIQAEVKHANKNFSYTVEANGTQIMSENDIASTSKNITITLNAADYSDQNQIVIKLTAIADGFTEVTEYTLNLKTCGETHIAHDYQVRIEFEFGDIIEKATRLPYEEGDAGTIDSYLFLNGSQNKFINYQQRTFDNGDGKIYLDYDRVSNTKIIDGIEQKEILTVDKMKGSRITYVLHDFYGFFHDRKGEYELSEAIKVSIFSVDEDGMKNLIKEVGVALEDFPVNENTLVPKDFTNHNEKGYLSLFTIKIPDEGPITEESITLINKAGIYYS